MQQYSVFGGVGERCVIFLTNFLATVFSFIVELAPVICIGLAMVFLEFRYPRRAGRPDGLRWLTGATLMFTGWAVTMLLVPVSAMVTAQVSIENGNGLLNAMHVPYPIAFVIGFLVYDFSGYAVHRILHEVPVLWRLHRVHHSDEQVDASTALRTHPAEALAVAIVTIGLVRFVGIPPGSIFLHFVFMQLFNFWHHANIKSLPGQRKLGILFNIPEFHEVHHSVAAEHHNSNYGSVLSLWDRMFGTLIDEPKLEGNLEYGLDKAYWDHPSTVGSLLVDPVRK